MKTSIPEETEPTTTHVVATFAAARAIAALCPATLYIDRESPNEDCAKRKWISEALGPIAGYGLLAAEVLARVEDAARSGQVVFKVRP